MNLAIKVLQQYLLDFNKLKKINNNNDNKKIVSIHSTLKNVLQFIVYYNSANNNLIFNNNNNNNNELLYSILLNLGLDYVEDKTCEDIVSLSKSIITTK